MLSWPQILISLGGPLAQRKISACFEAIQDRRPFIRPSYQKPTLPFLVPAAVLDRSSLWSILSIAEIFPDTPQWLVTVNVGRSVLPS